MNFKIIILFVLLNLFYCCDTNPSITNPDAVEEIFVLSILSPTYEQQEVYVGKFLPEHPPEPLAGAEVNVEGNNQRVLFKEVENGLYRDTERLLTIEPRKTYHLEVKTKTGALLKAHTTIPDSFWVISHSDGDTIRFTSGDIESAPLIIWQNSAGSLLKYNYFIKTNTTQVWEDNLSWSGLNKNNIYQPYKFFMDTGFVPTITYITAFDTAYSLYYQPILDDSRIDAYLTSMGFNKTLSNIEGGSGVFGSAYTVSLSLVVKPFSNN